MRLYLAALLILSLGLSDSLSTTNRPAKVEEYSSPGAPIHVKTGQVFSIRIPSNPTTGYGWQMSGGLSNTVLLVTNIFVPPDSRLVGAGGNEVWTFRAISSGQARIAMQYVRPWEQDHAARTNLFTVIVR